MSLKPQMNTDEHRLNEMTFQINGCAMDVLNSVGHGFHEKIYENAMAIAFRKSGLIFSCQKQYPLFYRVFVKSFPHPVAYGRGAGRDFCGAWEYGRG
jgi:hypothetical protein